VDPVLTPHVHEEPGSRWEGCLSREAPATLLQVLVPENNAPFGGPPDDHALAEDRQKMLAAKYMK
jgi:hypothetical protein